MTQTPKLELVNLHKKYDGGSVVAVRDLSLTVGAGETLAILGPSGCGKSTTLNMIVGIEAPSAGDIRIDGVSVLDQAAGQRSVGLVFQDYAIFTHMTVAQNIAFGLSVRGMARSEIKRQVGETAEMLGLSSQLNTRADTLGGSELQRVAIGRTLVTKPALLLLDEPLSNLETEMRATMRRELRRLQKEIGLTIVYVTHDQIEALSLASRIAVMSEGRLRQCAATHIVYEQPAHTFVAGFIGEPPMNLVLGAFETDANGARFVAEGLQVALPQALGPRQGQGILGLRPDAIRLSEAFGDSFQADVLLVEPRGAETVITFGIGGAQMKATVPAHYSPEVGTRVNVVFDPARAAFFSAETNYNLMETTP